MSGSSRIVALLRGAWEFFAGDDPAVALGVVLAIGATAALAGAGAAAWWLMPLAVIGLLALSLHRALRS
jgi:hypothetical protein